MSSSNPGLPDGTEDFVGAKAEELEELRSLFLNFFGELFTQPGYVTRRKRPVPPP